MKQPTRRRKQQYRGSGNRVGIIIILLIVVGLAVYFGAAGVVGNWLAEHVVSPVLTRLGLWESSNLPATETPIPSQASESQPPAATDTAEHSQGLQAQMLGLNTYFLQTGAFELESNASVEASSLQGKGGAGYVALDGDKYRVFISAYSARQDAESVRDKLANEGVESRVHVLECPAKNISVSSDAQKSALESAAQKYSEAVAGLNQASMSIEDAEKSRQLAAVAAEGFKQVRTELDKGFASGENKQADELYDLAGRIADELQTGGGTQASIQHAYVRACFEYSTLLVGQ